MFGSVLNTPPNVVEAISEVYSEPNGTSTMELFPEIVNG